MTPAPVLVTGGTGFVGGLITARLLADGRAVRALSRRPADEPLIRHLVWGPAGPPPQRPARSSAEPPAGAPAGPAAHAADPSAEPGSGTETEAERRARLQVADGHLGDPEALARAADGCEVVYHVAGVNTMCLRDPAPMYEANVEGTRRVLEAARAAGVRRVVVTSSASTLGGYEGTVVDETAPPPANPITHYARSKQLAEQLALTFGGVEVVAVNPSSVQGPGRRSGTAKLLIAYLNGRLRVVIPANFGLCYTDDCVNGHLLAETKGQPGERYVLNTATITAQQAIDLVAGAAGLPNGPRDRPRSLPVGVMMPAAAAVEFAARAGGKHPPLCRETVRTIAHPNLYDGSRAERELGLRYTPLEDALTACVAWYVQAGLVKRPLPGLA